MPDRASGWVGVGAGMGQRPLDLVVQFRLGADIEPAGYGQEVIVLPRQTRPNRVDEFGE